MTSALSNAGQKHARYVYPMLDAPRDLGVFRVAGAGIGNCLITYFHALFHAEQTGAQLIQPAWVSLKLGPLLRGERSKRFYIGLFRPASDEVTGWGKYKVLRSAVGATWRPVEIGRPATAKTNGKVTLVYCGNYVFAPLMGQRDRIRQRLLEITRPPLPLEKGFGGGEYIAVHVRLGDFGVAQAGQLESGANNLRISMDWYEAVIRRLRSQFPEMPVHVFSDGQDEELEQLLKIEGVSVRREDDDIGDLMALAGAGMLVGSQSTYSRWAAFLGNMPSIWFKAQVEGERYSDPEVPLLRIGDDASIITRAALTRP